MLIHGSLMVEVTDIVVHVMVDDDWWCLYIFFYFMAWLPNMTNNTGQPRCRNQVVHGRRASPHTAAATHSSDNRIGSHGEMARCPKPTLVETRFSV